VLRIAAAQRHGKLLSRGADQYAAPLTSYSMANGAERAATSTRGTR
jgi:hypothetical protein